MLYAFKYTGQLDAFDQVIYWSNIVATALQPALFLHFAFTFSALAPRAAQRRRQRTFAALLYLPGLCLVALQVVAILRWSATQLLLHRMDKMAYGYMAMYYIWAAGLFYWRSQRTEFPLERQQLKWLTRGTLVAVVPFTLLYVLPFLADWAVPAPFRNLVQLSLVVLPLTFSWAIVRYRLMDVDLIFKRGVSYTLATAALVGLYFGVVAVTAELVHTRLASLGVWGLIAAVVVTGLTFDPLKRAIQVRVDRVFDQKRFDYRETLIDFGRSPQLADRPARPARSGRRAPAPDPARHPCRRLSRARSRDHPRALPPTLHPRRLARPGPRTGSPVRRLDGPWLPRLRRRRRAHARLPRKPPADAPPPRPTARNRRLGST